VGKHEANIQKKAATQNIQKNLESDLDMLDMPQPWKHICMANILIQNVLQKKKENTTKPKGTPRTLILLGW